MKLELNLPALERLIGGDTEIEIRLRQQVCENFIKEHMREMLRDTLKSEVSQKVLRDFREQVQTEVRATMAETVKNCEHDIQIGWTVNDKVKWELRDPIRQAAKQLLSDELAATIDSLRREFTLAVQSAVKRHINEEITKQVRAEIETRLQAVWRELGTQK